MSGSLPTNGRYRLHYLPEGKHIIGAPVATEPNGRDWPISAAPDVPELQDKQIWEVRGVEDKVEILYDPQKPQDNIGQIGFHYEEGRPGVPIVLSFASKFHLEEVGPNAWRIRPLGNWVGVDLVVGLDVERHDETLAINAYPISPDIPLPAWEFEPLKPGTK
ncbi:hypothetical protein FRC11_009834 [Ceratobasidium sp. 423]|nr:hypothetical protein FRC11_009834 [Ceratobasidium sp. 423]